MEETFGRCPVLHADSASSAAAGSSSPASAVRSLPAGVDLADPDTYVAGVPHEAFRRLRLEAPVSWQDERQGTGFWSITKYPDVIQVSRDFRTFSSGKRAVFLFDPLPEDLESMQLMMLNMDPPRHTKLRGLVNKGFTPVRIAQIEVHVREICKRIIDAVARRGECDFVKDVAAELPLQVIAEMMGIPLEEREMVFDWSNRLIGFDDPEFQTSLEDGKIAASEMYVYANQLAEQRRTSAKDDLVSVLMNAEVEGEKLTELEFDLFFMLLAVAGNETTRNLISGGMLKLIENPAERARLLADRGLLPTAIEEMLRMVSPVMHFRRDARLRAPRAQDQRGRQGHPLVHLGEPRRRRFPRPRPLRRRTDAERAPGLRPRPAFLPRRQPGAARDPDHVRGAAFALARRRADGPGSAAALELHQRHQVDAGAVHARAVLRWSCWRGRSRAPRRTSS